MVIITTHIWTTRLSHKIELLLCQNCSRYNIQPNTKAFSAFLSVLYASPCLGMADFMKSTFHQKNTMVLLTSFSCSNLLSKTVKFFPYLFLSTTSKRQQWVPFLHTVKKCMLMLLSSKNIFFSRKKRQLLGYINFEVTNYIWEKVWQRSWKLCFTRRMLNDYAAWHYYQSWGAKKERERTFLAATVQIPGEESGGNLQLHLVKVHHRADLNFVRPLKTQTALLVTQQNRKI